MDFGLILGILVVVAIGVYIWLGRENDKLDGLEETFPSDCSVDTKPDVTPAAPPKAEPVFAPKPTPSAAQQPEAPKAAKPKAKAETPAAAVNRETLEAMTKKEIDSLATKHGVELDRRKTKAVMIDTFLKSL